MHHTKDKADIGVCKVIADLTTKGYVPCIPLSEHQAYDVVAISKNGSAIKIQAKYTALKTNGTIDVRFRRNWADSKGSHSKPYSKKEFDYYAIYCPQKDTVVYVRNDSRCPKVIRFGAAANNQAHRVKWAKDYLNLKQESSETIRCTPEMAKT